MEQDDKTEIGSFSQFRYFAILVGLGLYLGAKGVLSNNIVVVVNPSVEIIVGKQAGNFV